jgi:histone acetyltransferase
MVDIDIGMGDQELDPMIKDPGEFAFGGDDDGLDINLGSNFLSESGPSEAKMKSDTDYEMTEADKEEVHHEGDVEEEKEDVEVEANEEESVKDEAEAEREAEMRAEREEDEKERERQRREKEEMFKQREQQKSKDKKKVAVTSEVIGAEASTEFVSRDSKAKQEEREGVIKFEVVENDNEPQSLIYLTALKNIFSKQLPEMPKEYIARLVFDKKHRSLALVRTRDSVALGGICFRPFTGQNFLEIVFCAVTQTEQEKGYGSHMMNHLKIHSRSVNIENFLTYADNYAINFFKKQGFTQEITWDRVHWGHFIKDYVGGTIMHCHLLPKMDDMESRKLLRTQKQAVLERMKDVSNSTVVYKGMEAFKNGAERIDVTQLPGLMNSGWDPKSYLELTSEENQKKLEEEHLALLDKIKKDTTLSWPFLEPVDRSVPMYYDTIKDPIDLSTIEKRVKKGYYITREMIVSDLQLMVDNCRLYNNDTTDYFVLANKLEEKYLKQLKIQLYGPAVDF